MHRNMQMRYPKAGAHNKSINRLWNLSTCSIQMKWRNTSWKLQKWADWVRPCQTPLLKLRSLFCSLEKYKRHNADKNKLYDFGFSSCFWKWWMIHKKLKLKNWSKISTNTEENIFWATFSTVIKYIARKQQKATNNKNNKKHLKIISCYIKNNTLLENTNIYK